MSYHMYPWELDHHKCGGRLLSFTIKSKATMWTTMIEMRVTKVVVRSKAYMKLT